MTEADRLAIEWECAKLSHLFAQFSDARQWDEAAALFTEDGVFLRPTAPDKPLVGRDAIAAAFRARPADRVTRHFCANTLITVESAQRATGHTYILLFTGPQAAPLVGDYRDRFRHTPEGWRFEERRGALSFPA